MMLPNVTKLQPLISTNAYKRRWRITTRPGNGYERGMSNSGTACRSRALNASRSHHRRLRHPLELHIAS